MNDRDGIRSHRGLTDVGTSAATSAPRDGGRRVRSVQLRPLRRRHQALQFLKPIENHQHTVICDRETPLRASGSAIGRSDGLGNAGASLNLIVGHTSDGLHRRRHDRLAIVLELHAEPQIDAVQFEEAPAERAAGNSD